ncbi:virus tail fiber assembly protein lambda gpK [Paraburkholderia eburnea]|uniref:Virus tail fiber assembly protein lambda gpK n=1 Tax=Paraburkholderia eburnea TaxID=1189126 RepID=A0A2S4LWC9_9BURK|nr:tail fiber assembly protein [Paraburkholderia eburnea]POR46751.1 virus tail fiber assembly protein lambda gpK [Paraburkholderia eburnea]PRZ17940.1 virus tail fiber assembly protein lambda gpK [Paraburkholderia eburnea]
MLIHQYDNATGQYISSNLADPDPKNLDRWLVPAFSTDIALPERARNEWPFFVDGAWALKPDYRGQMLYRTADGTAAELLMPGIAPADAGLTTTPRPSDQYVWSDGGWALDPVIVAAQKRAAAMQEFEALLALARAANAGKADAYAAGLLSPAQAALFKAWANYQLDLVRVIDSADFPNDFAWPAKPDPDAIAAQVEADARAKAEAEAQENAAQQAASNDTTTAAE